MATVQTNHNVGRPLIFGEVLYDRFPDGNAILGGAPFNVAWHLQGFGLAPLLLSRVGTDVWGRGIIDKMSAWGMDTAGIQSDPDHSTGSVSITLQDNQPNFTILEQQAYDFIAQQPLARTLANGNYSLLYHGSLALRSTVSRHTLHWLRDFSRLPAFVDINLRSPWWTTEEINWALRGARWLKLNSEELRLLTHAQGTMSSAVQQLQAQSSLDLLILTLGDKGAIIFTEHDTFRRDAERLTTLTDTVGAGDAFSAVTILGLSKGWHEQQILKNAIDFAAAICSIQGATLFDHDFYAEFAAKWEA